MNFVDFRGEGRDEEARGGGGVGGGGGGGVGGGGGMERAEFSSVHLALKP